MEPSLMRSDPLANSGSIRVFACSRDEVWIDVQGMHMTVWPSPLSDFDCRIAGTAAEFGNGVPSAKVRRFIESR